MYEKNEDIYVLSVEEMLKVRGGDGGEGDPVIPPPPPVPDPDPEGGG